MDTGMDPQRFRRIAEIFEATRERAEDERPAFLEEACAGDAELLADVHSLMVHHEAPSSVLDMPAVPPSSISDVEPLPEMIGPYRVVRRIGEGGMGLVYLAQQTTPVRRTVAVKLIKRGMDTSRIVARFEMERQALAMLQHPNVASIFDAGAADDGRPYFVMEHVEGDRITTFCDRNQSSVEERLALFLEVCEAIGHAHQNGIIHRDIKPSNILVTAEHGRPIPKVIDFGVARAVHQRLTEKTVYTEEGLLIGTPQYMSPEQAALTGEAVDTRTDVFALGVVLYELLTGRPPLDPGALRTMTFDEMCRRIRDDEPTRPSTYFARLDAAAAEDLMRTRGTTRRAIVRRLRGDLDWIVVKAMEKDRDRRYDSVSALAADVRRHLRDEPVEAGPPGVSYRLGKLARRHRALVAATAAVLLVLVAAAAVSATFAVREARARNGSEEARLIAESVNDFLRDMLGAADPRRDAAIGDIAREVTVVEVLDHAVAELEGRFDDASRVEQAIRFTLGETYLNLGHVARAESQLARAHALADAAYGPDDARTLAALAKRAEALAAGGRYEEAAGRYRLVLDGHRRDGGPDDAETAVAMSDLANVYHEMGRYDEAEALYVEALGTLRDVLEEPDGNQLIVMNNLAVLYMTLDRNAQAEPLYVESLELHTTMRGPDHADTLDIMGNLASLYMREERWDEAESLMHGTLEARRRVLGDEHASTLIAMNNLAGLHRRQGRLEDARSLYAAAYEAVLETEGAEHPTALAFANNLARVLRDLERYDEAEVMLVKTWEIRRRVLGEDHPDTLVSRGNLARLYILTERYAEAEEAALAVHTGMLDELGAEHRFTVATARMVAELYEAWGREGDAAAWRGRLPE